jgi:uncharacterized protein
MPIHWQSESKPLALISILFFGAYFLPVGVPRFDHALRESLELLRWYAREHVILCLIPAFFIAGAIGVFIRQSSILAWLGPQANKLVAYSVASVSGTVLAACSCTVLPIFAGIWRMGAGLGPAATFLYAGPAINVLAIILTARILGLELGIVRTIGAVVFSVAIGVSMHLLFRHERPADGEARAHLPESQTPRPAAGTILFFGAMIGILVFANWSSPEQTTGLWHAIAAWKWPLTAACAILLGFILVRRMGLAWWKIASVAAATAFLALAFPGIPELAFVTGAIGLSIIISNDPGEPGEWFASTWIFAKQILPLLLIGVFLAGLLLGRPGQEGLVPSAWIHSAVGGNSISANLFASVVGAFMYFATLTEVPILQGLIGSGMGKGPALALLLAGPALSLPSMLVLRSLLGARKTAAFVVLVVVMSTLCGLTYGAFFE